VSRTSSQFVRMMQPRSASKIEPVPCSPSRGPDFDIVTAFSTKYGTKARSVFGDRCYSSVK
jgi:hypothetical protein